MSVRAVVFSLVVSLGSLGCAPMPAGYRSVEASGVAETLIHAPWGLADRRDGNRYELPGGRFIGYRITDRRSTHLAFHVLFHDEPQIPRMYCRTEPEGERFRFVCESPSSAARFAISSGTQRGRLHTPAQTYDVELADDGFSGDRGRRIVWATAAGDAVQAADTSGGGLQLQLHRVPDSIGADADMLLLHALALHLWLHDGAPAASRDAQ